MSLSLFHVDISLIPAFLSVCPSTLQGIIRFVGIFLTYYSLITEQLRYFICFFRPYFLSFLYVQGTFQLLSALLVYSKLLYVLLVYPFLLLIFYLILSFLFIVIQGIFEV
jgi:hypothetical protein